MPSPLESTLAELRRASALHDRILVAYSGGKDSLAILDLCSRAFKHVECFYMWFIPGLRCVEEMLDYARKRWNVQIAQYPHWDLFAALRTNSLCTMGMHTKDFPRVELSDIYKAAMQEAGCKIMASGAKNADSLWRRRNLANTKKTRPYMVYPVKEWTKRDVLAYLKARDIPLPSSGGGVTNGVDLREESLFWLHDAYPDDFERLCVIFPLARAIIKRREWYGKNG